MHNIMMQHGLSSQHIGISTQNPYIPRSLAPQRHTPSKPQPHNPTSSTHSTSSSSIIVHAASSADTAEDLWQYEGRDKWYLPTFAADDMPDWNPGRILSSRQLSPAVKEVVLEIEISRERVPLRNAYKHVGQLACVRVNGGVEEIVPPTCPPFPSKLIRDSLYITRGDLVANHTKTVVELDSTLTQLTVWATKEGSPELFKAEEDAVIELGAFRGGGMDLRGPIAAVFTTRTIIMFVEADGIAAARALVTATPDVGGLSFPLRNSVRIYYRAANEQSLCFRDEFESWEQQYGVKVVTSTRDSFSDMFDFDDTLMYEPESTAAIILTGESEEAETAALEVCKEAEIELVVKQREEQKLTRYLTYGKDATMKAVVVEEEKDE